MRTRLRYWGWKDWLLGIAVAAVVLCVIAVVGWLIYALAFERHEYRAQIVDRWWTSSTRVTYTTSRVVVDTANVCTGTGSSRVCRLQTSVRTVIDTHTRCRESDTGRDWPVTYPPATCKRSGDSVSRSANFRVKWRPQETEHIKQNSFGQHLWQILEPDTWVTITTNGLGNIVEVE